MFQQPGNPYTDIANLKEHLKQKTADELRSELDDIFAEEASTGIKIDQEVVEAYLNAIDSAEPNGSIDGDFKTSWETFTQNHPDLFKKPKPKTRRIPVRYLIEVAALIACLLIGSATAFPAQWTALVTWGKEILNIAPSPSGVMELTNVSTGEFSSLAKAVEVLDISAQSLPTWIPEQYSIERVLTQETKQYKRATAIYSKENGDTLLIRVTFYFSAEDVPELSLEKNDDETRSTYPKYGTDYLLTQNVDTIQAGWLHGTCLYSISGPVTEPELKKIIDSICGGR